MTTNRPIKLGHVTAAAERAAVRHAAIEAGHRAAAQKAAEARTTASAGNPPTER